MSNLKKKLSWEHIRIARKAAYWQPRYDEWKKQGVVCAPTELTHFTHHSFL
jgi:hypothetical protein|tara:strand:+ start:26 stop:178 length:153 start_codon:yes stop_codon:yes gene_type:complete